MIDGPLRAVAVVRPLDRAVSAGQADLRAGARDGARRGGIIKLASNENPLGISPRTRAAIDAALGDLARYPDGNGFELKQALAKRYGVDMASIVLGNGSNDVLELAARAFLRPGREAVYSQHCFAVYPLATQARGARSIEVPAQNYGHDLEAMAQAIDDETYVAWIANPNNPTGTFVAPERSRRSSQRCRSACWWCSTRPTTSTCRTSCAATGRSWLKRHPEPGRHAHLLQGLRPGRAARRLRARASGGGRPDEPRAPAVQRQQPRARRGDRGARRHGVRGAQLRR